MIDEPIPNGFYECDSGDGLKKDRRRRPRHHDDDRIEHLFNGLDNLILTARENHDEYGAGYVTAMRGEFGQLIHSLIR